jgi:hypothetical protein
MAWSTAQPRDQDKTINESTDSPSLAQGGGGGGATFLPKAAIHPDTSSMNGSFG